MTAAVSGFKINFLEVDACCRVLGAHCNDAVDDAREGAAKLAGGEEGHVATVVDRQPFWASGERLVMGRTIFGGNTARLGDGALVNNPVGGHGNTGYEGQAAGGEAEGVAVEGVLFVELAEGEVS